MCFCLGPAAAVGPISAKTGLGAGAGATFLGAFTGAVGAVAALDAVWPFGTEGRPLGTEGRPLGTDGTAGNDVFCAGA